MTITPGLSLGFLARSGLPLLVFLLPCQLILAESEPTPEGAELSEWQQRAVEYARIMSGVKWTPAGEGMPARKGTFEQGKEYTGVPYSSVKHVGRYIGYDIYLKTFLAAVENPESVVYTENLYGKIKNAECYYGKVCSSYTSYALQCGFWYLSYHQTTKERQGMELVQGQSAQNVQVGDIIFTPPRPGSHVELVTDITRNAEGKVTHVRVEESRPQTTMNTNRTAAEFDAHLGGKDRELYRITDFDAWRANNRAESLRFPNYEEDSASPTINRVLLLDRGDWVPYYKNQAVKFHVMDRDEQGVKALVIMRDGEVVEEIPEPGKGVLERSFAICGDYRAHCILKDGSASQACEFSVCDLDFQLPEQGVTLGKPWEVNFSSSENMDLAIIYLCTVSDSRGRHLVYLTDEDRQRGKVVIPGDLLRSGGKTELWLIGENQYGRLKERKEFLVK